MAPLPTSVSRDANSILDYLQSQINQASDKWLLHATTMSIAYDAALDKFNNVFSDERKIKKADEDAFNFVASLLTVGIVGGVGGALARGLYDGKVAQDAAKQTGQFAVQKIIENFKDMLDPVKAAKGDPFAPIGPSSVRYFLLLTQKIQTQKVVLNDAFDKRAYARASPISAGEAEELAEWVLDQPYYTTRPQPLTEKEQGILAEKMRLALWIAWAFKRDLPYWFRTVEEKPHDPGFRDEAGQAIIYGRAFIYEYMQWTPVVNDLLSLEVPLYNIALPAQDYNHTHFDYSRMGLDVWGFCMWIASDSAPDLLFKGLPQSSDGFDSVKVQMKSWIPMPTGWVHR